MTFAATRRPAVPVGGAATVGPSALVVAFVTLLVVGTDLFVVSPLLPAIARQYDVTPGSAGSSVTVFSLAYMVGAPFVGALADRAGRRPVLVAGLAGFAVANLLTAVAPWFVVLLAARLLAGVAASAVTPSVLALVGQSAPDGRRGTWMSTAMAGFLISITTGAPTGTMLAAVLGWRAVFVAIGVLAGVFSVINAVSWTGATGATGPGAAVGPGSAGGTTPRPAGDGAAGEKAPGPGPAAGLGNGSIPLPVRLRAVSVTGIWAFSVYAFYTYLGTTLSSTAKLSTDQVATALVIYGIGAVAGSLGGGRLADRYGAGRIATLSLVLLGTVQLAFGLALHAPAWLLLTLLGLFSLTAYPCLPAYQSRLVGIFRQHSGSILAWNSCFMYLGTSLGAAAGGMILSATGFWLITLAGAGAALIGAVVYNTVALPHAAAGTIR